MHEPVDQVTRLNRQEHICLEQSAGAKRAGRLGTGKQAVNGPGHQKTWQGLLRLESHDIVLLYFERIHARRLSARRAGEINAAVRQAREYFRNADVSDYSVRPLLTFYGIACLGRALLLLMKPAGGEDGLAAGHGLETVSWRNVMNGGIAGSLKKLGYLKMRRRPGLFSDFLVHTRNMTLLHQKSAAVDGYCEYDEPDLGVEISLGDLFARTPDLWSDYTSVAPPQYANVSECSLGVEKGVAVKLAGDTASAIASAYGKLGYAVDGDLRSITCDSNVALSEPPMFVHAYMDKMFGLIPNLRLAVPFCAGVRFSQLCITYMMSYALGMLVRYYPTHWIALINGGKGDLLWPTINRAQQYVESVFPELVAEYVTFAMDNPAWVAKGSARE